MNDAWRRVLLVLVGLCVGLLAGGCGLPGAQQPTTIAPSAVPFGLLQSEPATATGADAGPRGQVYFLQDGRLRPVTRSIRGVNQPADLVRALLLGPRPRESQDGLTTAIPSQTRLLSLDVNGRTATLDLSKEFGELGGAAQVQAVAQLVYTVTQSNRIDAVRFSVQGKPVEVPDATGSLTLSAVAPSDYPTLPAPR
ncbi:MAG: GerMN domain-containing protein [Actinomycetes bacterium]